MVAKDFKSDASTYFATEAPQAVYASAPIRCPLKFTAGDTAPAGAGPIPKAPYATARLGRDRRRSKPGMSHSRQGPRIKPDQHVV